jgi:hypothetical protein
MKHHFVPWTYSRANLQGFAKVATQEGDATSCCTRCGVFVKVRKGTSTTLFWNGKWVRRYPCTGSKA